MLVTKQHSKSEWLNSMVVHPLSALSPLALSMDHNIYTYLSEKYKAVLSV